MYDQYLAEISQGGSVSGSDTENSQNGYLASGDMGSEGAAQLEYGQQEKRLQLLQNLTSCRQALEEAERSKETTLQAASRAIEDAENGLEVLSAGGAEELDIAYREKELYRLDLQRSFRPCDGMSSGCGRADAGRSRYFICAG